MNLNEEENRIDSDGFEILKEIGDWRVFKEGVEYKKYYYIEYERIYDDLGNIDFLTHLRGKNWFDDKCEHDFLEACFWCSCFNK